MLSDFTSFDLFCSFIRFEADLRIKFHVGSEREKLIEEWEKRVDELKMKHEQERQRIMELNDEARDLLRDFLAKQFEHQREILLELMQQSIDFEAKLQNTLKDLEVNEKHQALRNQCIDSLDLQRNLMTCRQMTETMHYDERRSSEMKDTDMKNDFANSKKDSWDDQSKSLKQLWIEFQHQLDGFDSEELRGDEKEILNKIHQIRGELMMKRQRADGSRNSSVIQEPIMASDDAEREELVKNLQSVDWIGERESRIKRAPYVNVKRENDDIRAPTVDSFMSSGLNRFSQPQRSMQRQTTEITSSIIALVRNSNDDLKENITAVVEGLLEASVGDKFETDASVSPTSEAVNIKESVERRFS